MNQEGDQRLSGLNDSDVNISITNSYSRFVKIMRWALPFFALVLMVIVITWPELDEQIEAVPQENILGTSDMSLVSNKLINPEYQTTDSQNNPVNIKASKATQSQNNKDLIRLDIPEAEFQTKQGNKMFVRADQGTYDQVNEKLFLQNSVKIQHDSNYTLEAKELRLNMKTQEAFSDKAIIITNEESELKANGLDGNMQSGELKFQGPAKIIFSRKKESNSPSIENNIEEKL